MMPGIVDLHVHPFATPLFNVMNLDFSDPFDVDQMLSELSNFAEANPDKTWIRAGSYGLGVFPDENPGKELIDRVIPDRPVIVIDQTGHNYWVNSKALELAGIDRDTPTDDKYIIEKDPVTDGGVGRLLVPKARSYSSSLMTGSNKISAPLAVFEVLTVMSGSGSLRLLL